MTLAGTVRNCQQLSGQNQFMGVKQLWDFKLALEFFQDQRFEDLECVGMRSDLLATFSLVDSIQISLS